VSYKSLPLKEGKMCTLGVQYVNGLVSLRFTSKAAQRVYPAENLMLSPAEWDRLVKWVALQRAEDALAQ
jgi:hypothetical protein